MTFSISIFLIFCIALLLCRVMEGRFFLALPNERSAHDRPTSQGGGAAIFLCFCVFFLGIYVYFLLEILIKGGCNLPFPIVLLAPIMGIAMRLGEDWITMIFFLFMSSPLAITGMIDDRKHISALWRFVTHVLFSIGAIFLLHIHVSFTSMPWLNDLMLVILMIAFINACNFSDGINGMLSGTMLLWLLYTTIFLQFPFVFLLLFGAILGFFFRNFPNGRIFLGDCGSTFLAGMILLMGFYPFSHWSKSHNVYGMLETMTSHTLLQLLIVFAPFVFVFFDICLTLILRVAKGHSPLTPHKEHLMQQLLHQHGWSHKNITILYGFGAITAAFLLGAGSIKGYFFKGLLVYLPIQVFFCCSVLFCRKSCNKFVR